MDESQLNKMKVAELKSMAEELGVEYSSKAKKAELVEALIQALPGAAPEASAINTYQVGFENRHPYLAVPDAQVARAKAAQASHLVLVGPEAGVIAPRYRISMASFLGACHQDSYGGDVMLACPLSAFEAV